jgi:hypothetical protein
MRLLHRRNKKALQRKARIESFCQVIKLLSGYKNGKTFMVDTEHLKDFPPCLHVTERLYPKKMLHAVNVASTVIYCKRKSTIEIIEGKLTYVIF